MMGTAKCIPPTTGGHRIHPGENVSTVGNRKTVFRENPLPLLRVVQQRQVDDEGCSVAQLRENRYRSSARFDDALDDRQAESGARLGRPSGAIERIERLAGLPRRHSKSVI